MADSPLSTMYPGDCVHPVTISAFLIDRQEDKVNVMCHLNDVEVSPNFKMSSRFFLLRREEKEDIFRSDQEEVWAILNHQFGFIKLISRAIEIMALLTKA